MPPFPARRGHGNLRTMFAFARTLQLAGLITVGAGAVLGFDEFVPERTMWMLWGGGLIVFYIGTMILRRTG